MQTLSATAVVDRLRDLGFTTSTCPTGIGMTLLRRDERRVIIPHVTIEPAMLHAILRSAGISEAEFFRAGTRSGVYTKTMAPGVREPKTGV
jgi:predicted RNA binding protein YcfA (HicA-like mRNA interferase family)